MGQFWRNTYKIKIIGRTFFGKSRDRGAGHQHYKGITEANLRFFEKIKVEARLREAFVATQV